MVSIDDIRAAAKRLNGHAIRTPLIENDLLNDTLGGRIWIKPECLQRIGAFKFRGAINKAARLKENGELRDLVAYSSGNHAQAVAAAAKIFGVHATIIMPSDAPEIKKAATKRWGAKVVEYDRYTEDRKEIAETIASKENAALVPPYEDADIMAGQGTSGLEAAEDLAEEGIDQAIVCCGGGGLAAGFSTAIKALHPSASIFAAEPADFDDTKRSLQSGKIETVAEGARSICDAIVTPSPGEMTFAINKNTLTSGLTATDDEVLTAMRFAFDHLKLVTEPGGAIALACLLNGSIDARGKNTLVMISGGNVDPAMFHRALTLE